MRSSLDYRFVVPRNRPINTANMWQQFLFLEPNASDPLNKDAAEDLRSNREGFKRNVRTAMGGGPVRGVLFEKVLK